MVAGLVLVAPALPARPEGFRRAMTATQQLQALARMALLRSDTAGKSVAALLKELVIPMYIMQLKAMRVVENSHFLRQLSARTLM